METKGRHLRFNRKQVMAHHHMDSGTDSPLPIKRLKSKPKLNLRE